MLFSRTVRRKTRSVRNATVSDRKQSSSSESEDSPKVSDAVNNGTKSSSGSSRTRVPSAVVDQTVDDDETSVDNSGTTAGPTGGKNNPLVNQTVFASSSGVTFQSSSNTAARTLSSNRIRKAPKRLIDEMD